MKNFIKFDVQYDVAQLQQELAYCLKEVWTDHFNTNDYQGRWECISLRSESGKEEDIRSHPGNNTFQDTAVLQHMPYVKSIIDSWNFEKESIRLMALYPGSEIKPHRDPGCRYQDGALRLHIPVVTHPLVQFNVDGEDMKLEEGSCWYIDFSKVHWIKNASDTVRVHLVIDGKSNGYMDDIFAEHGIPSYEKPVYDEKTKLAMIAQLELMDTDTAREIIKQLKGED
ncbi:aspartyl/asparaginyl beta-hydroxylase domain-containing protein [Sphingobacterium spiritivorum]|uniref:aspartyl/asparaginyl beta-hydroxylase domain-containing protein n=1 Tax=Sphingobacterium spiritivorum TaxID=258 RepID=UPI00191B00F8|nr:aspartyl/asparaginyl beta-hydroxylase domain-containing protein [Sphingobacterium spiritivorum]QQT25037.1 aspartyl/asparaginyl beta-hydroxylase domain-containing protein [Sphingobacterium spiritivorum]